MVSAPPLSHPSPLPIPLTPLVGREREIAAVRELLYHPDEYNKVVVLRRALTGVPPVEAMELLLNKLKKTQSNIMFLLGMATG